LRLEDCGDLILGEWFMKAVVLTGVKSVEYRDVEPVTVPAGWVHIRMRYVGICGSDVHYYTTGRIGDQVVTYPFPLGHEGSGEIIDGAGRFDSGTPVYIEPAIACGHCDQCLAGRKNTCRNLKFLGNPREREGCMCAEIAMPAECAVPLPAEIGLDEAVLLEPLCIGVYAVLRSRIVGGMEREGMISAATAASEDGSDVTAATGRGESHGGTAAIVGAGPIGMSVLLGLSDFQPAGVFVSEPIMARREAARRLGADVTFEPGEDGAAADIFEASDGGVDVAFECVGTQEAIDDAARMLKPGGTLVLIGIPPDLDRITYDPNLMRRREIAMVNIRRQNGMIGRALALLARRRDAAKVLLTHRFPPSRADEAFEVVRQRSDGVIKALLEF